MSKKLAVESDGIILDVKVGSVPLWKYRWCNKTSYEMVILQPIWWKTTALAQIWMNPRQSHRQCPRGKEAIETLKGNGPDMN